MGDCELVLLFVLRFSTKTWRVYLRGEKFQVWQFCLSVNSQINVEWKQKESDWVKGQHLHTKLLFVNIDERSKASKTFRKLQRVLDNVKEVS